MDVRAHRADKQHAVVGQHDLSLAQRAPFPGIQGFESTSRPEMSETGRTVPDMNEPLSSYDVTVTVGSDGRSLPGPAAFAVAADQAA